jgi:hypothetical protein
LQTTIHYPVHPVTQRTPCLDSAAVVLEFPSEKAQSS